MTAVSTVRFFRTNPLANPAALVAAWLVDALRPGGGVEFSSSDSELIMLDLDSTECQAPIRQIAHSALTEPRFAGWELAVD